jgi:leucyl-tRNA synthetase
MAARYNFRETEAKWQRHWEEHQAFRVRADPARPKYYMLEMFPYPSGRIHMGHVRNYTMGDLVARYKLARGHNVLHPIGWDAFGLPAENAAMEAGVHPLKWTYENIATMRAQLKGMGISYDWSREVTTCAPDYYKHEQKIFLDFLAKGLAYRKESWVNWDPVENTVLANEQVEDGRGWRSGAIVEKRKLAQWFLRSTAYADELLAALDEMPRWDDRVRVQQRNWIGRSEGAIVRWEVDDRSADVIEVFTTRPDTLFGASFIALSPEHPLTRALAAKDERLADFVAEANRISTSEAAIETAEKVGYDTGLTARHPLDPRRTVPVWVANFVLMEYGTGAIFGCPAHDQRDLDFARKYRLAVVPTVCPPDADPKSFAIGGEAYLGDGTVINSGFLDGLDVESAKKKAIQRLESEKRGKGTVQCRLRDWGVSRQRYWGCPIPVIHCEACGIVPVPEKDLPVELPADATFDKPGNPLDHHPTWKHVDCPKCGKKARRETDTFDTFWESSWYFFRYCDPHNAKLPFSPETMRQWMPVDQYIGGIEHAVMHLFYLRFFARALGDCGYFGDLDLDEPIAGLFCQGMVVHETYRDAEGNWLLPAEVHKTGDGKARRLSDGEPVEVGRMEKMSKSKKNVIDPENIIDNYGADTARLFVLSNSPPDRDLDWSDSGVEGAWRYLNRVYRMATEPPLALPAKGSAKPNAFGPTALAARKATHRTIAGVSDDIERFHFNKAVARVHELTNALDELKDAAGEPGAAWAYREGLETIVRLLGTMTPHLAEELWQALGHTQMLARTAWPEADKALTVEETVTIAVQVNGKLRGTIELARGAGKGEAEKAALALPNVAAAMTGKPPKRVIVVPDKIVNVVIWGFSPSSPRTFVADCATRGRPAIGDLLAPSAHRPVDRPCARRRVDGERLRLSPALW